MERSGYEFWADYFDLVDSGDYSYNLINRINPIINWLEQPLCQIQVSIYQIK